MFDEVRNLRRAVIGLRSTRLLIACQGVKHEFESCGEKNKVSFYKGILSGAADALERVKARAGLVSVPKFPYAYTDRAGTIHLPFDQAVEIARRLCAAEPDTFLINAETTESKSSRDVRHGEDHLASLLNEHGASFALIRQWAGHDAPWLKARLKSSGSSGWCGTRFTCCRRPVSRRSRIDCGHLSLAKTVGRPAVSREA
jgi:hypothetical protein